MGALGTPECQRGGLQEEEGGEDSILAIPTAPDRSSVRPRGWGEPRVWGLDFWLVPNSSSFDFRSQQLDAVPLFLELPLPAV